MLFVAIHELGHLMTKSIGHNTEFWDNMRFLLKEAISANLYTKEDYLGIELTSIYWHFLDVLWLYLFVFLLFSLK